MKRGTPNQQAVFRTYSSFWPHYLSEHKQQGTRQLHFLGSFCFLLSLVGAVSYSKPSLAVAGLLSGYAFAWVGHFFVEHNRPTTFQYPLWSLISDFRMFGLWLLGRLPEELQKARLWQAAGPAK